MRVKIYKYDQGKGKGEAIDDNGGALHFRYTNFRDHKIIEPGEYADYSGGILHPIELGIWEHIKIWFKEAFKWR